MSVADRVAEFISEADEMNAAEAETRMLAVLRDLLSIDAIDIVEAVRPDNAATDFIGVDRNDGSRRIGVEYKHYTLDRVVNVSSIDQVLNIARRADLLRVIVISRSGFTTAAVETAHTAEPVDLQLVDLGGLLAWARRVERPLATRDSRIVRAIEALCREAAQAVAENPGALDELEWRDFERMMAHVLQELGLDATLTPGSKDGGKDIIVTFPSDDGTMSFIVELKHWRSGKHVGRSALRDFVQVVAREGHDKGLLLATYGYTEDALTFLSEIERRPIQLGGREKIVSLCQMYSKVDSGLWSPVGGAPNLLFSDTA